MRHEFEEGGVVIASDGHATVVFTDEIDGLAHLVGGEISLDDAQIELADDAEGHEVAVELRRAGAVVFRAGGRPLCRVGDIGIWARPQRERLECMAYGVAEVEGFAEAVLQGILGDDALLDGHAVGQHALEGGEV